jgi:hypothetical protein
MSEQDLTKLTKEELIAKIKALENKSEEDNKATSSFSSPRSFLAVISAVFVRRARRSTLSAQKLLIRTLTGQFQCARPLFYAHFIFS